MNSLDRYMHASIIEAKPYMLAFPQKFWECIKITIFILPKDQTNMTSFKICMYT